MSNIEPSRIRPSRLTTATNNAETRQNIAATAFILRIACFISHFRSDQSWS